MLEQILRSIKDYFIKEVWSGHFYIVDGNLSDVDFLKEGQYFIGDLLDLLAVREDGTEVGTVEDVLKTGANSVLVIKKKDGKELLLPVIPDCVLSVDSDEGIMTIHVLPGLED